MKYILLIDDDEDELFFMRDALHDLEGEYLCTHARSTAESFEKLKNHKPDFIFIDFNLPQVNGLQLLQQIRSNQSLDSAKVFLYSTSITDETNEAARKLSASGCIEKPKSIGEMTAVLTNVLSQAQNGNYFFSRGK